MNNRVTSEEVANQLAKAILLLLEWTRQEILNRSQYQNGTSLSDRKSNDDNAPADSKRFLKAAEVAEILQVSQAQAYRLMHYGGLRTIRMGRIVRVKQCDLEEFIEKSKAEGGI